MCGVMHAVCAVQEESAILHACCIRAHKCTARVVIYHLDNLIINNKTYASIPMRGFAFLHAATQPHRLGSSYTNAPPLIFFAHACRCRAAQTSTRIAIYSTHTHTHTHTHTRSRDCPQSAPRPCLLPCTHTHTLENRQHIAQNRQHVLSRKKTYRDVIKKSVLVLSAHPASVMNDGKGHSHMHCFAPLKLSRTPLIEDEGGDVCKLSHAHILICGIVCEAFLSRMEWTGILLLDFNKLVFRCLGHFAMVDLFKALTVNPPL
jgi:hypothetical protein